MESLPQALDRVYRALAARAGPGDRDAAAAEDPPPGSPAAATEPWTALDHLSIMLGLTPFEQDVLVLLTGHALQARFARVCGTVTFGLALTALDTPHWSALSTARPLRYWHLVGVDPGSPLHAPLHMDERILAYLIGMPAIDERLHALIRPLRLPDPADGLDEDAVLAGVRHWSVPSEPGDPLILEAPALGAGERTFRAICDKCGLLSFAMEGTDIPGTPADREMLARLWSREAALRGAALYIRTDGPRTHTQETIPNVASFLALVESFVGVGVPPGGATRLTGIRLRLRGVTPSEQRQHARQALGGLATRVEPAACANNLVLPDSQLDILRQIVLHVRHKSLVNDGWGFAARHPRGQGLTALFTGSSGTGKTMAAEVIAAELGLDLYRIDLATVVSKYIGETEKNLREIFTAATDTEAILLFDEADALFGKRSEVRDSHDRYANLEVSYLLQQMEAYRGAAILTTNMQHALDQAFMRRLRFVVAFPLPDAPARERIWRGIFPAAAPLGDLDWGGLAQLNVPGGVIRNIATLAAFLAADDGGRVETRHILAAVRTEYAKLDKPLTPAETRGLR